MKLRLAVPGMMCPIGWADTCGVWPGLKCQPAEDVEVDWSAIYLPRVRLSHPVHLMIIEGAAPSWLFMGAKITGYGGMEGVDMHGPFFLLRLTWPALHKVPFELTDVALGAIQSLPNGVKLTSLLPAMISTLPNAPTDVLDVQRTAS